MAFNCKYVLCESCAKLAAMYVYVLVGTEGHMSDTEYITLSYQPAIPAREDIHEEYLHPCAK